ncbi:uncharacterized protein LOC127286813 [Leptopilina boulardi]|uniref:uncharacterized protein LOC127286813 n=1 Tax=Leptopilina boulardi TaxID=63433 RepID=UPI0021F6274C|nr:uncharacterized protein LOC127286813 [Leptopilina boulardi]XP_051169370.1 uncharacterized protein LOC127286813 [Leptopilina boulardi]
MWACKLLLYNVIIIYFQSSATKTEWFQKLINYIQIDSRKYQVFLISNNDDLDNRTNHVLKIAKHFPTQLVNFNCLQESRTNCLKNYHQFPEDPRQTNLNIILPSRNVSKCIRQTIDVIDFLITLSKGRTRPKFLVIFSTEKNKVSYKKLLHQMWNNQVLDATILKIDQKSFVDNYFLDSMIEDATIIQYNPFSRAFTKTRLSSKSVWFPDKLRNLHQSRLMVALQNFFPLANVSRNASGHVTESSGVDANIIKFMAREINFSLELIPNNYTSMGPYNIKDPKSEKRQGLTTMLSRNELNILANSLVGKIVNDYIWTEMSREVDHAILKVLVPIQKIKVSTWIITGRMIFTIAASITLILFLLILARFLNLEKDVWQLFALLRMIFTFVADKEPKKTADQIIYVFLLLTSMILSMGIFEVCTDLNVNYETEIKMDTLNDFIKSGLKPMLSKGMRDYMFPFSNGSVRIILKNAKTGDINQQAVCLEELVKYRNVGCIVNSVTADYAMKKYKDQSGESLLKLIPEPIYDSWFYMFFEQGSPYATRFNQLFLRIQEVGIRKHFQEKAKILNEPINFVLGRKELEKMCKLIRIFFFVFLVGNCLTTVVFLFEIFMTRRSC